MAAENLAGLEGYRLEHALFCIKGGVRTCDDYENCPFRGSSRFDPARQPKSQARAQSRPKPQAKVEQAPEPLVTVDAGELLKQRFRPLVEAVPGLVVEGLTMLIGGPKKGKSWLAYQVAVAVATGGEVLGRRAVKGDVLYLALEDGERRAQSRIQTVMRHLGQTWPKGATLEIGFNAKRGEEVVVQVEDWLACHPDARLVIIDTLQKIRPAGGGKRGQYEVDVEDMGRVLAITQRHPGLAVMVVHHDRKQASDDFLDAASGTHGITGSVDTALVLKRDRFSKQGTISVTGRDVREEEIHVAYDEGDPFWTVDGEGGLSDRDRQYLKFFQEHGPAGPTEAGASVYPTQDRTNAARSIKRLVERGILRAMANGQYDAWPIKPPSTPTDNADNSDTTDNSDNGDNGDNG